MKNEKKQNEKKIEDIILETNPESINSECKNIIQKWERKCPRCSKLLCYSDKYKLQRAIKYGSECNKCTRAIVLDQDYYFRKCPTCNITIKYKSKCCFYNANKKQFECSSCRRKGITVSETTKQKLSILAKQRGGRPHTKEHREKILGHGNPMYGIHRYDELNPFYGKRHSDESRRKMRISMCQKILKMKRDGMGRLANIGNREEKYFDDLEKEHGWNGNRQYFISTLGYFVDYYEPSLNIVVEYDEPRHYKNGCLIEKDVIRMNEIKSYLNCQFWRYNEYKKCIDKF